MQSAGGRISPKYFTTKKQDINFTSLNLTGYSAHFLKKKKRKQNFKFEMKNNSKKMLV